MPLAPIDFRQLASDEGSPFGGALAKSIAMRLAQAKTQSEEAKVPFAGITSAADAMSKMAYANLMGPQFMAKLLGNENLLANIPEEQKGTSLNYLTQAATGGGQNGGIQKLLFQQLLKQQQRQQPNSLQNSIMQMFGGGQSQQAAPQMSPAVGQTTPNIPQQVPTEPGIPQEAQPGMEQTAQSNYAAPAAQPRGTFAENTGQYKGTVKAITENLGKTGTIKAEQTAKTVQDAQDQSAAAQQLLYNLDDFHTNYKQSLLKGPALGRFAAWGPNSAQAKQLQSQMQVNIAGQLFGKGTTNYKEELAAQQKLNVDMPPETEQAAYERAKSGAERASGRGTFYQTMTQMGISDPQKMDQIWYNYNKDVPYYDHHSMKPIPENTAVDPVQYAQFIRNQIAGKKSLRQGLTENINPSNSNAQKQPRQAITNDQVTVENLQHTASQLGISVPEVIKRLEKKGIKVPLEFQ